MSISSPAQKTGQGQIYQNFIGGEWRNSRSGETFTSTNPAHTSQVIGHYQKSTAADLEDAIDAAVKAQPGWAATPAPERGEIMLRAALLLEQYNWYCWHHHTMELPAGDPCLEDHSGAAGRQRGDPQTRQRYTLARPSTRGNSGRGRAARGSIKCRYRSGWLVG